MSPLARRPLPPELEQELAHRTEGQELAQVWELLAIADPVAGSPEAEAAWERVSAQIATGAPLLTPVAGSPVLEPTAPAPLARPTVGRRFTGEFPARRPVRRWHPAVPWALAATLTIAVGLSVWQSQPVTVIAPFGEQRVVALPDGSTAELNAGSSIEYARGFRRVAGLLAGARVVSLDGEAFFSVVPGNRPFTVSTGEASITVMGTRFLVAAHRADSAGTRVAVEEGRVRVRALASAADGGVDLTAGQGTRVAPGASAPAAPVAVGVERLTLWRRGGLAFVDQPLGAILRELERRYAVDIRLRDVVLGDERISVYYSERPSVERVLTDLCTSAGLRFSRTSRGFEITPQSGEREAATP